MGRGKAATVGDTRVAKNGYHYTKVETGWRFTHHLTAEKVLGRPLEDNEMVKFGSKGKKFPYDEDNVVVIKKRTTSLRRRKAELEAKIEEYQAQLDSINRELAES